MSERQKRRLPNTKLRAYRKARNWTQEEFAARIEVSVQTLRRWENGEHAPPTPMKLHICRLLDVTPQLLGFEPEEEEVLFYHANAVTLFASDQSPIIPVEEKPVTLDEPALIPESQRMESPLPSYKIESEAPSSLSSESVPIARPIPILSVHSPRLLLVGLLCLSLTVSTLFAVRGFSFHTSVPPVPSAPASASCFSDEFHMNDVLSNWQWIDIDHDSSGIIDQKGFSISVSQANKNLWTWNNNAPRLIQPATGNFTVETQVEFDPQHQQYQGAGLLIYGDSGNYIRLERAFSEFEGIEFEKYEQSKLHTISSTARLSQVSLRSAQVTNPHVQLELQREGDTFIAHWRPAGSNQGWRYVGKTTLHLNKIVQVGLILVSDIKNKPTFQAVAHYNYFHISCL